MKVADLGQYLEWEGRLYKVEWINEGHRSIGMRSIDQNKCPHCNGDIGQDTKDMIESSPLFQKNAIPIQTLKLES